MYFSFSYIWCLFPISLNINYCCTFVRMLPSTLSPILNITVISVIKWHIIIFYTFYSNLNLLKTFKTSVNCCKLPYYMEAVSPFMMPSFYYIYVIKYLFYLHVKKFQSYFRIIITSSPKFL